MDLAGREVRLVPGWTAQPTPASGRTWESLLAGPAAVAILRRDAGARAVPVDLATLAALESGGRSNVPHGVVERLVWDGVLEIEQEGGGFASGCAAVSPAARMSPAGAGRLTSVALRQVALREPGSDLAAARRLYLANAFPYAGARGDEPTAVGGPRTGYAPSRWGGAGGVPEPWRGWVRLGVRDAARLRHKIYVSPVPKQAEAAFAAVVAVASALGVPALKVAGTRALLHRPDKIVLHVHSQEDLRAVAAELERALHGIEPQGVPFAAPLDARGLLSWAVDPDEGPGRCPARSWRIWIALLLARGLGVACGKGLSADEQAAFALGRVRLEGVDPAAWAWAATAAP